MDIAKYIGLYLLKNKFVYIHGLGNLEIRKKPASYSEGNLQAGDWEVVISRHGSVDDNISNFIAVNESCSLSKASNELREFSTRARAELLAGKDVIIPSVGKFVEENGIIRFLTDPHILPPAVPAVKIPAAQDQPAKPNGTDTFTRESIPSVHTMASGRINWMKIALFAGIFLLVAVIAFFGIRYASDMSGTAKEEPVIQENIQDSLSLSASALMPETINNAALSDSISKASSGVKDSSGYLSFDLILNTYTDFIKAQKRTNQLLGFGNVVSFATKTDSTEFYVVMPVKNIAIADSSRLIDSISRIFNPQGVKIFIH